MVRHFQNQSLVVGSESISIGPYQEWIMLKVLVFTSIQIRKPYNFTDCRLNHPAHPILKISLEYLLYLPK
ncbi:hypothetical protein JTE90_006853 [Oedothorax gibbosus]|uniref:Uncharacterized protein n=1 Tax=Oedothorax gibbosus TaxID=931172 RepID=A0AAV6TV86_9ARAC|nr:hypothetical protein JTE90_006853 [Oedothorax gibbosus]